MFHFFPADKSKQNMAAKMLKRVNKTGKTGKSNFGKRKYVTGNIKRNSLFEI